MTKTLGIVTDFPKLYCASAMLAFHNSITFIYSSILWNAQKYLLKNLRKERNAISQQELCAYFPSTVVI